MILGKETSNEKPVAVDLELLIESRLLIQANSGGGKSWLLRRLLEQSHGKVQQIVLDLEGEFSTLREKFDYLLVGKDGEVPTDIRTAELLARKVLELKVSVIVDLSELKHHERTLFVKRFLDALVNAPRELWHPVLVVVDEAHQFAPENGKAESAGAVIDLCTRGRKRGYCAVLATQRISKLHKDAAAECNNQLVGRTGLDIDMKRAAENLGFTTKEQMRALRDLEAGEFFAFGPAISREVIKMHVGSVETSHPRVLERGIIKPSKTPKNIEHLLSKLVDLPREAKQELRTREDLQNEVTRLRRELTLAKRSVVTASDPKAIAAAAEAARKEVERQFAQQVRTWEASIRNKDSQIAGLTRVVQAIAKQCEHAITAIPNQAPVIPKTPAVVQNAQPVPVMMQPDRDRAADESTEFGLCARKLYSFLFHNPERTFSRAQIGAATGYSCTSGGFKNALSQLYSNGLISKHGDFVQVRELRPDFAENFDFSPKAIIPNLGKCEREIYEVLLQNPGRDFMREELAETTTTRYSPTSGGFKNAISRLHTLGLISKEGTGVKLNPELLEV